MFLIPSLLLAAVAAGAPNGPETVSPEPSRQLVRSIYAELIASNTSYTTGQTTPAAEAMAKRLLDAGFPREDVVVAGAAPHKANVVVRYRGTGKAKPLLLLAHLDVVEAKREDWSVDPFTLLEKDGYFYGRGTGDDKAQAAIWVANLIRYKQEGFRPERDLIVALTADEEGGGPYSGVDWLLKNRRELIDAELCLNEGGWGEIRGGKRLTQPHPGGREALRDLSARGQEPGRAQLDAGQGERDLPPGRRAAPPGRLRVRGPAQRGHPELSGDPGRASSRSPWRPSSRRRRRAIPRPSARCRRPRPPGTRVVRTTCVATGLDGGHAVNALPQTAGARVNCRVLPGQTPEEVQAILRRVVDDDKVTISITDAHGGSPMSPLRDDVLAATKRLTSQFWPGVVTLPYMVMGGTDGRMLRQAGIPTYGVQGIFFDTSDIRFHGRDERVGVREFYEGQEFLYRLVKELAQ